MERRDRHGGVFARFDRAQILIGEPVMMNVAITLAVPDRTGSSRMQALFAEALVRRGHNVRVLHGAPDQDADGLESSFLDEQRRLGIETELVSSLRRPIPFLVYRQLEAAATGADVIIGFQQRDRAAAMKVAARCRIPGIVAAQNQHRFSGRGPLPLLKRRYYARRLAAGMQLAVCTSTAVQDEMVTVFGVAPERCVVLPNGIPAAPPPGEDARSRRLHSGVCEFIAVGRLDEQKGYHTLLQAWAEADFGPDVGLRIVGGTTAGNRSGVSAVYEERLRQLSKDLGVADSVIFHGPSEQVGALLENADAFVHSAHWEGPALPLAVLEAMNAELPVVFTDCSGWPPGFVQRQHGIIVKAESVAELSAALIELLLLPAERRRDLGHEARRLASTRYNIDAVSGRFVDLVESMLETQD